MVQNPRLGGFVDAAFKNFHSSGEDKQVIPVYKTRGKIQVFFFCFAYSTAKKKLINEAAAEGYIKRMEIRYTEVFHFPGTF